MAIISVINGPNLNMLGTREPGIYGAQTLADIEHSLTQLAEQHGHELLFYQSNAEHDLVNKVQQSKHDKVAVILLNPAAFTHTSVALRDALLASDTPFIELHLSNVHARESFRQHSYFSDIAKGVICGFGPDSYKLALLAALPLIQKPSRD
ncbi:MAG: 3-dehydroquinate dehydratase-2 [Cycloclasticus pugetii]|jgi:3-dehydroquinate dehydratase-2|uniref:3-dehydroquinate dehydratase n=1 Tax=Cycloclasticus zancles 78-ME TaxID=1198232 RepID=S5TV89_9GAMM|nr:MULTISPECIES: type II 3-dehydroquinate dehydratase [Cycloclasticus]AFT67886.1 3-dehydroquinate dehydratase, type II [Cycloclasticus sp. P1]AGS38943.1 3-dehydroquinate dehydratase II [Cycloclasticus zancles 78-ME]MBV1899142.1 type II 3-dehydroquinate dehydratase [Cycloclasticus sp.]MDF1828969.1 type II 3-dehydroquinate dehydratase [Cycloclasticus pugetii]PHR50936.1 MAG: type II 3-dehydroquinate dehydratase [Cycloclasticus sp.]|tara:strand:- start:98 stop:550 length:453 start_codon:yes stop_codon:yes gene_type:complete